jgi:hypothetical protein
MFQFLRRVSDLRGLATNHRQPLATPLLPSHLHDDRRCGSNVMHRRPRLYGNRYSQHLHELFFDARRRQRRRRHCRRSVCKKPPPTRPFPQHGPRSCRTADKCRLPCSATPFENCFAQLAVELCRKLRLTSDAYVDNPSGGRHRLGL